VNDEEWQELADLGTPPAHLFASKAPLSGFPQSEEHQQCSSWAPQCTVTDIQGTPGIPFNDTFLPLLLPLLLLNLILDLND